MSDPHRYRIFSGVHAMVHRVDLGQVHPALLGVAQRLERNATRVSAACRVPLEFGWWSRLQQRTIDAVLLERHGTLEMPAGAAEREEVMRLVNARVHPGLSAGEAELEQAQEHLEGRLYADQTGRMDAGLQALLASTLVGAWSAVELALGDVWETALNGRPSLLMRGQLGTMLRREPPRYSFQALNGIRAAYAAAFDKVQVTEALASPALAELASMRHVIVHRAGIADAKLINERKSIKHRQITDSCVHEHMPVIFYGREVQRLCEFAFQATFDLIVEVGRVLWETEPRQ